MKNVILSSIYILVVCMTTTVIAQENEKLLKQIQGDWEVQSVNDNPLNGSLSFYDDKIFSMQTPSGKTVGTYTLNETTLLMARKGKEDHKLLIKSCNETTLKLYDPKEKATIILSKSKTIKPTVAVSIVGNWKIESHNEESFSGTLSFNDDKTFSMVAAGEKNEGTYRLHEEKLFMTNTKGESQELLIQFINETTLKLYSSVDEVTHVFSKEKQ
ncbi:lipocalin family protein [Kordia sp.]|uniref:lipocalin family protein n=1 Tax=Kordia sp. TaxID=1965332 RepID=UPI003D6AF82D